MATRKRKNPAIKLPSKFTPAQVRVNDKGQVQIRINPAKVTKGKTLKNVVKVSKTRSITTKQNAGKGSWRKSKKKKSDLWAMTGGIGHKRPTGKQGRAHKKHKRDYAKWKREQR